jgi:F0F1-type ATP synthase assembly protein I
MWNSPAFGLVGIGFQLATSIVLMTVLGRWLDGKFETSPILTVVFLFLGLLAGLVGAYRQMQLVLAQVERRRGRGDRTE